MAQWDSADCLARLRRVLGRDTYASDTELTDAIAYQYLGDAQREVTQIVAQYIPSVMYGVPVLLTTSDNKVYTCASEWIGHVEVYDRLGGHRLVEGDYADDGADFTVEGPSSIRITGNRERTFSAGPYARFVAKPTLLNAATEPTLKPTDALQAVVYLAAADFADRDGGRQAQRFRDKAHEILWGANGMGGIIPTYRMQFAPSNGPDLWYRHIG